MLNNRNEKLREERQPFVEFPICERFVEKMLRIQYFVIQDDTHSIHQINIITLIIKSVERINHEYPRSKTNQNRRLSAKFGLYARQTARQRPLVQITIPGGNGSLVQGEYRPQSMVRLRAWQRR